MEFKVLAARKLCFAVEVGDSALGFIWETVGFEGLAVVLAGSVVEKGVPAVEKGSAAVVGKNRSYRSYRTYS